VAEVTHLAAAPADLDRIRSWRSSYRREMNCQIVHDSIHERDGWSEEYLLSVNGTSVGYGSVAVGGPWAERPALYEFYVAPDYRPEMFELFDVLLATSFVARIEVQSNDAVAATLLHAFAGDVQTEAILFHDCRQTFSRPPDAIFREPTAVESPETPHDQRCWCGVVELGGNVAASGGVLFHYNPPFGDIYMEVEEPFRRRGFGSFLVQELKRLCYAGGYVPAARCRPDNVASRRTLERAGFAPCGHMLTGTVTRA
jgi:GNAT superfamily N-acetyltransferase